MYGTLNFGTFDWGLVANYMTDLWNMFSLVIYVVLGIAAFGAVISMVLGAVIRALRR